MLSARQVHVQHVAATGRDLSMELGSGRQELGVTAKQASKPLSIQGAANIPVGVGKSVALAALAVNEETTNANVSLPRRTREKKS